jgi:ATP-dependent DNA ligase
LKYDGFYVRLKRDSTNTWRIYSRNGIQYHPPTSFLQHLTTDFPDGVEIEAELVYDTDQTCPKVKRENEKQRIVKRTKDFDKLHVSALRSKKDMSAWNGLRLVLFALVWKGETFKNSFKMGKQIIEKSQHRHPHIRSCNYMEVKSTADTIEIFKSVVQMGLEGIVLRKSTAKYSNEPNTGDTIPSVYKMRERGAGHEGGANFQNEQRNCTFTDSRESVLPVMGIHGIRGMSKGYSGGLSR